MNILRRIYTLGALSLLIGREYSAAMKIRTYATIFMILAQNRLPRIFRKPRELRLKFQGKTFSLWMSDRTGLAVFKEVFIDKEYRLDKRANPKTIVDAGANIGVASLYFLLLYPHARVFAIEPDPDVCLILQRNLSPYPNASIHQCALSDSDGKAEFYINPKSSIGSSMIVRTGKEYTIRVHTSTLDSFLNTQSLASLDMLKFDIEGGEEKMLRGINDIDRVSWYIGEVHPDIMSTVTDALLLRFKERRTYLEPIGKRFILQVEPTESRRT